MSKKVTDIGDARKKRTWKSRIKRTALIGLVAGAGALVVNGKLRKRSYGVTVETPTV